MPGVARALTLTNPGGLFVLLLLGPLLLLYVLRAKRTRRVVSSVWLWSSTWARLSWTQVIRSTPVRPMPVMAMAVIAVTS